MLKIGETFTVNVIIACMVMALILILIEISQFFKFIFHLKNIHSQLPKK